MNEMIKRLHRTKLIPALISIVFGVVLILARRSAVEVVVKIAAGLLIACGVGCVLMFLFAPVRESMQLAVGTIMAALGLLAWFNTGAVVELFPLLTGIGLVLNGLSNLASLKASGRNAGAAFVVIFSALMIIGGLFICFHRNDALNVLMIYMGVGYVFNGIFDLILLHRVKNILMN